MPPPYVFFVAMGALMCLAGCASLAYLAWLLRCWVPTEGEVTGFNEIESDPESGQTSGSLFQHPVVRYTTDCGKTLEQHLVNGWTKPPFSVGAKIRIRYFSNDTQRIKYRALWTSVGLTISLFGFSLVPFILAVVIYREIEFPS